MSNSVLTKSYGKYIRNKIFKIIPLLEEENEFLIQYVCSLLYELNGASYVVEDMSQDELYMTTVFVLESTLDYIIDPSPDHVLIKSELFRIVNLINTALKGE